MNLCPKDNPGSSLTLPFLEEEQIVLNPVQPFPTNSRCVSMEDVLPV